MKNLVKDLKSWHDNIFHREFYLRYFDKDNVVANNVMFAALYTFKTAMTLLNWTFGTMVVLFEFRWRNKVCWRNWYAEPFSLNEKYQPLIMVHYHLHCMDNITYIILYKNPRQNLIWPLCIWTLLNLAVKRPVKFCPCFFI